jgi:hypothetical protein
MEKSEKQKTTAEVSLKDSLNNWQAVVFSIEKYRRAQANADHFRFWDEMWNEGSE